MDAPKKITLDMTSTGTVISDPVGTSAILIRLHDRDFEFANAKDDGGDIASAPKMIRRCRLSH